ncbi:MAG: SprT family zinc-dependent metalloprotease, partial [Pseudomonadota bacterium]
GVVLPYLGASLQVVLGAQHAKGATLVDVANPPPGAPALQLQLGLPPDATPEQMGAVVQTWLQRQAKRIFEERLSHYAPQLGVQWQRLGLSNANTRWGSASSGGNIRLNWRLVHLRPPVLDYVVVHELAHLRVMDHSPRFWATVGSVTPDYAALRAELKAAAVPRWD